MVSTEEVQFLAALLEAVGWPLVAVVALLYFGPALRGLLAGAEEFTLRGAGFEATVKNQFKAGALYGAALAEKSEATPEEIAREIEHEAAEAATRERTASGRRTRILWVDDTPENNFYERATLEAEGMRVTTSTSTEDALAKLDAGTFDVVITDMGRPEGDRAGYDLLERKQEAGDRTPLVVYSGSGRDEHKREARRRGAVGATNRPQELFELVRLAVEA